MSCYKPSIACRMPDGNISFRFQDIQSYENLQFPCGNCVGCRLDRARDNAVRCMHEASLHSDNTFLTLTYDEKNLKSPSLVREDIAGFNKRLRAYVGRTFDKKIGIFGCGEYGAQLSRPHFHLCVFNFDFSDKKMHSRSDAGDILYRSTELEKLWKHGFSVIGDLTFASACYVARYCTKKVNGKHKDEYYSGRLPEFAIYPRRPALGKDWIEQNLEMVAGQNFIFQKSGIKTPVPRYYQKQIEKLNPELYLRMKEKRDAFIRESSDAHRDYAALKIQLEKHNSIHRVFEENNASRIDDYDLHLLEILKTNRDNYVALSENFV